MGTKGKSIEKQGLVTVQALSFLFVLLVVSAQAASAQYQTDTLRTPLIYGASSAPAYSTPYEGQAPPIGDGYAPPRVTPGHLGYSPELPASHVPGIPTVPAGEAGKAMVNGYVAPYLSPPTNYDPADPGSIDNPPNFYQPPVNQTNINPGGGISGSAPITRWGGQCTQDFGRGASGCSSTVDFGQKLSEKPDLYRTPQTSQDGPRQSTSGRGGSSTNRASSLPGAQTTQDLNGNRTLFKGPNQRARLTIANY
ncbi:hypothetical protein GC174_11460 [bacterium]|nr:hypothetical protein [bacterium]